MGDNRSRGNAANRDLARAVITGLVLVLVATVYGILRFDYGGSGSAKASTATTVTMTVLAGPETSGPATPATVTETVVVTAEPTEGESPGEASTVPISNTVSQASATDVQQATPEPQPANTSSSPTQTSPASPATPPPGAPGTPNQAPPLSAPVTSGRVRLTVNAVSSPATVPMLFNRYEKDNVLKSSAFAQFLETPPQDGAKYVRVDTTIENIGDAPFGLTCDLPIHVGVLDAQQQRFDPIPELFRVKGNPECNEALQPGRSGQVAFVFEVPRDDVIGAFGFQDVAIQSYDPTLITF